MMSLLTRTFAISTPFYHLFQLRKTPCTSGSATHERMQLRASEGKTLLARRPTTLMGVKRFVTKWVYLEVMD